MAGRPKGSKNKKTVAREKVAQAEPEIVDDVVVDAQDDLEPDDIEDINLDDEDEDALDDLEDSVGDDEDTDRPDDENELAVDRPTGPPPGMRPTPVLDARDQMMFDALQSVMPQRKVLYSQFKTRSKFNPTGARRKMSRICYQNGYRCNIKTLFDEEISLIEKLKPGRYINKLVTVAIERSPTGDEDKVHIAYSNKTADQRINFKNHVRSFVSLLRKCVNEAAAREALRKQRRR